jgi:hypothetical protein
VGKGYRLLQQLRAAATVRAPKGYIVPQAWREAIERLQWNGVEMARFDDEQTVTAVLPHVRDLARHGLRRPYVPRRRAAGSAHSFTVQPGDYFIPLKQANARYAVETLEPQGHDSFFRWGFFNSVLEKKEASPTTCSKTWRWKCCKPNLN